MYLSKTLLLLLQTPKFVGRDLINLQTKNEAKKKKFSNKKRTLCLFLYMTSWKKGPTWQGSGICIYFFVCLRCVNGFKRNSQKNAKVSLALGITSFSLPFDSSVLFVFQLLLTNNMYPFYGKKNGIAIACVWSLTLSI